MITQSKRTAFTLIELIASAALASLMMAGIFTVTWSALRESRQLERSSTNDFPPTKLIEHLRVDLQHARGMRIEPAGLTIHGFVARDPTTKRSTLAPGRVQYQVKRVAGQRVLTRTYDGQRWEPLWFGFGRLLIEPLNQSEPGDDSIPQPETGGLPEVPLSFRVTMTNAAGNVLWQEVINHHEN